LHDNETAQVKPVVSANTCWQMSQDLFERQQAMQVATFFLALLFLHALLWSSYIVERRSFRHKILNDFGPSFERKGG